MSTQPHASDHLYLFIYANYLLSPCAHWMNINIYLFTYSNQCQQNHTQATTCICLFMQITCCLHVLFVWILISICLLIQRDVNKIIRSSLARSIYESDPELDKEYIATSYLVSLMVEDSSCWTVPIYSFTSQFNIRSVTNVATSDLLPELSLGDPFTDGGYGGKSNSLLDSCLIYFTCSSFSLSVSDMALVSFSLIFLSFPDTRCLFREKLHLNCYTIAELFQYILLYHISLEDLFKMLQHLISYQCSPSEILSMLEGREDTLTVFLFLPWFFLLFLRVVFQPLLWLYFPFPWGDALSLLVSPRYQWDLRTCLLASSSQKMFWG